MASSVVVNSSRQQNSVLRTRTHL